MSSDREALTRLVAEIDEIERRLGQVSAQVRGLQSASEGQASSGGQPQWPQLPQQQDTQTGGERGRSTRHGIVEALGAEGAGSRLLAWVGGAVTLLGVVLLLALAIQRGWLGPLPRLVVGDAFGLGLIGAGLWLYRKPAGRTGALAVAATGIAALYLDAVAATTLYGYLTAAVGLAAALVVGVGGLVLAAWWDSVLLGMAVVVGCAVCAPLITQGFTAELVVFVLMVQVATAPVQLRRNFAPIAMAAGIAPVVFSVLSTVLTGVSGSANTAAAVGAGLIAIVLGLLVARRRPDDPAALVLLAQAAVPALVAGWVLPSSRAVGVSGGMALVLLAVWASRRWWPGWAGEAAGAAGLVALLQATLIAFDGTARAAVLLAQAILLALVARWTRDVVVVPASLGFGVLGAAFAVGGDLPPWLLVRYTPRGHGELAGACGVAVLLVVASIVLVWASRRLGVLQAASDHPLPWAVAGLTGLYGAAGVVLSAVLLVLGDRSGFLAGHVVITVSWTVAALVLLVRGIDATMWRVFGLVLVAAAVLKLVLFDLAALDGMARVVVFLCAGLTLLAAGTRYARLVTTRTPESPSPE